jgi:hypothetical protein
MRTLLTQMRLKRLVRVHADAVERMDRLGADGAARERAVRRLLAVLEDVRDGWDSEVRRGMPLAGVERQVRRGMVAIRAAVATLERPAVSLDAASREFREAVVPLLFLLRGLDEARDDALFAWLNPPSLRRSA